MTPADIIRRVTDDLDGVVPKQSWGETSLFYNPGKLLPNGVYFCTLKEQNGDNDKSSDLSRPGVYRLGIGVPKELYKNHFGEPPKRPKKGGIVDTGHDFTELNVLTPHPIYGWMSWVCVLSPTVAKFSEVYSLIVAAHGSAVVKFDQKTK